MTEKGQVTIPAEIRRRLGLKPRDVVRFEVEDGLVRVMAAPSRVLASFGAVTQPVRPEDWKAMRRQVEELIAQDVVAEDPAP